MDTINRLILIPSYQCNMSCPYCMQAAHRTDSSTLLPLAAAQALFDQLFTATSSPTFEVTFSGGEPLLHITTFITPLIVYMRRKEQQQTSKRLIINILTNGSFIPSWLPNYLNSEGVTLSISYDGRQAQQYRDPTLQSTVESNLQYAETINSVFTPATIPYLYSAYEDIISISPVYWSFALDTLTSQTYTPDQLQLFGDLVNKIHYTSSPVQIKTFDRVRHFQQYLDSNHAVTITPNGLIYLNTATPFKIPNQWLPYLCVGKNTIDPNRLTISRDIFGDLFYHILATNTSSICSNCALFPYCHPSNQTVVEQIIRQSATPVNCLFYSIISSVLQGEWE